MSNRLKYVTFTALLLSLSASMALAVNPLVVKHTLAQVASSADSKAEADKLFQEGLQQYRFGEYPKALQTYQRVLEIRRKLGDKAGVAQTLNNIGQVYIGLIQIEDALKVLHEALVIHQELKDRKSEGETLDNIGWANLIAAKDDKKTLEILEQALAIRREVKDKAGEGKTISNIGIIYTYLDQQKQGLQLLQDALAIHKEFGDKFQEGLTLFRIGLVYFNTKDKKNYPIALDWFNKSLAVNIEIGNFAWQGRSLQQIGRIYFIQNEYNEALKYYDKALPLIQKSGTRQLELDVLTAIGDSYFNLKEYPRARETYQQALSLARELKDKSLEGGILATIGTIYFRQEKYKEAIELYQQALPIVQEVKDKSRELNILTLMGDSYFTQEKYKQAIEIYQQALLIAQSQKEQSTEGILVNTIGNAYFQQKQYDSALKFYRQALTLARKAKNESLKIDVLANIGNVYSQQKQYEQAIKFYQQELQAAKKEGNSLLEGSIIAFIGDIYYNNDNKARALEFYQQSLPIFNTVNNPNKQLAVLMQIMRSHYSLAVSANHDQKDYSRAIDEAGKVIKLAPEALNIASNLKQPADEKEVLERQSRAYTLTGNAYNNLGDLQKAQEFVEQGLKIARQSENLEAENYALLGLSQVYYSLGQNTKRIEFMTRRLEIAKQLKKEILEVQALDSLSQIYAVLGDFGKSIDLSRQAFTKIETIDINKLPKNQQDNAWETKYFVLWGLTISNAALGEYEQALKFGQQNLDLVLRLNKPAMEAQALINLSDTYAVQQSFEKAIELYQKALNIAKQIKNTELEADILKKLSQAYTATGNYQKATGLADSVFKIGEQNKNIRLKLDALDILREIYTAQGNYKKSLEFLEQGLTLSQQDKNPSSQFWVLVRMGSFYSELGDYQKAIKFYEQALRTGQKLKNPQMESLSLFLLAITYFGKGEPQKTIEFAQQGLAISQTTKMLPLELIANVVISIGYGELGNEPKAMKVAQASLALARKGKNPNDEKTVLTVLGNLQRKFGKKQEAIQTYNQALAIKTQAKTVGADSGIYASLGRVYADLNQPNAAISYYKEAINRIEEVRRGIKLLTPELQASFLQTTVDFGKVKTEDIYRQLADLLSSQGQEAEAQQVMELLKIQELNNFARETTGSSKITNLELSNTEKQIINKHGTLIAFGSQLAECKKNKCSQLSNLITQHRQLTEEFNSLIENLKNPKNSEVDKSRIKDVYDRTDDLIAGAEKIVAAPKQPDGTVLIYPLVLKDKVRILWAAKGGVLSSKVCQIGESELTKDVSNFRRLLQQPDSDITQVKATGKKLYDCLIKPIESELKANKVKHLVFVPDRAINYIPMAALFDGEKYLIENYSFVSVLNAGLTDAEDTLPAQIQDTQVLGLGLSNKVTTADGTFFPALNSVPIELDAIVKQKPNDSKGIYPGTKFLNQAFTRDALENNLDGRNILHIATHGLFKADNPEKSYILLGTGVPYPITQIKHLQKLREIHLVVLSACETALGGSDQNGIEIQGMSAYFLRDKAKSVMASLWVVSDRSTAQLMQQFYSNLANSANSKTRITKAEALRQAQLSLLNSNKSTGENTGNGRGIFELTNPDISSRNENNTSGYSHPYYWAPFILIGNGL